MGWIDPEVREWLREKGRGEIIENKPIHGGSINQSLCISTETGAHYFLKQNNRAPAGMFFREAQGLKTLQKVNGPFTPFVFLSGKKFLLLENLEPSAPCKDFWPLYGRQLARLHLNKGDRFGLAIDNYIGSNPQYNDWHWNGYEFYRLRRFIPQIVWARNQSLIDTQDVRNLERFLYRLPDIIPNQIASLLHGDLWSGNLITDKYGMPALVDPAVYYGWPEADLAMAELFGSYPDEFYQAYQEIRPLEHDFRSRFPIYNLYHLLNHLNMFGPSYLVQIKEILGMFSGY